VVHGRDGGRGLDAPESSAPVRSGLALAAGADARGIDYTIVGEPMGFWRSNMPRGMLLRSTCDWHLDVERADTIDAWLGETGRACAEVEPLGLDVVFACTE
jgi:hypothetical protein